MATVHTLFDCQHEVDIDVRIDDDVAIPETAVRGLGKCPACIDEDNVVPVSGVAPGPGGALQVDSILLIPIG